MPAADAEDYRCPECDSTDLHALDKSVVTDELLQCRSCLSLLRFGIDADGRTRLIRV